MCGTTNWKLLYENFMDAYHVFKVHKNSFAKNGDNTLLTTMHDGTDHYAYHLVGHDADAASGVAHPSNTTLDGEWRHTLVLGAAFPTHVMQLQPDWLWYLQLSPLGVDQVRIRWDVSVAPEVLADQADPGAYISQLARTAQHGELPRTDPIVEGVFRGVHGRDSGPWSAVVPRTQRVRLRSLHRPKPRGRFRSRVTMRLRERADDPRF